MGRQLSGRRLTGALWAAGLVGYVGMALADVWDPGDYALFSANELVHGSEQAHELGPGGDADPGGRMPTTWPERVEDTPAYAWYPGHDGHVEYGEGLLIGHRWYEAEGIEPLAAGKAGDD